MNKQFLKKMEKRLKQEESEIIESCSTKDSEIDGQGDETDQIQANLIIYLDTQIGQRQKIKLKKINEALAKIKNGIYGICEECEENIPEKRLEFNPYFDNCIKCAEIKEKELKQVR